MRTERETWVELFCSEGKPLALDRLRELVPERCAKAGRMLSSGRLGDPFTHPDVMTVLGLGWMSGKTWRVLTRQKSPPAGVEDQPLEVVFSARSRAHPDGLRLGRLERTLAQYRGIPTRIRCTVETGEDLEVATTCAALAHAAGATLWLTGAATKVETPGSPALATTLAAGLHDLWKRCQELDIPWVIDGLQHTPLPDHTAPGRCDANALMALARGHILHGLGSVRETTETAAADAGGIAQLGPLLKAHGHPVRNLPLCMGGDGRGEGTHTDACTPCPARTKCPGPSAELTDQVHPLRAWSSLQEGAHIVVLAPDQPDNLLTLSTLPGLVTELRARGAQVTFHTPFDVEDSPASFCPERTFTVWEHIYWNLHRSITRQPDPITDYRPPVGRISHPLRRQDTASHRAAVVERWWATLDLSSADLIVVPGFHAARRVWEHPTRPHSARVQVADFHLLDGAHEWARDRLPPGQAVMTGGAWNDIDLEIVSCFPRYAKLYRSIGIDLRRIVWRPYPLWSRHCEPGPPPHACGHIWAGGAHLRDWDTLARAVASCADLTHPIDVHADPSPVLQAAVGLRPLGRVGLEPFWRAIQTARFVVLPLHHDADRAAGLTVASMALAAGRPVVATCIPGTLDHLRHGIDSLLVPAGDADALADAISRLDADEALLHRLHRGAVAAKASVDVRRWASTIVDGLKPLTSRDLETGHQRNSWTF
ncbi:MAG: glycosyltransferase [Myxococcota bacterium]